MARLSVIVTSYNIEDYLEQCLDDIVGQTLQDLEIIVVDDGSSDSSPEIISACAARDPRIVPVLLEDNTVGGVATAANVGLDRATSEWVAFADGDDRYDADMFETLVDAAESHDADLAMCQYQLLDDTDGSLSYPADQPRWDGLDFGVVTLTTPTRRRFLRFIAVPWRKVYRRSMLESAHLRFPVGDHFYEDNPFHWFTLLTADSLALVPDVLCYHRTARPGSTMSTVDARLFRIFDHHDTILRWLVDHHLDEEYGSTLLAWAISQMEWISRRTPKRLHRQLFDTMRGVFGQHEDAAVIMALAEKSNPKMATALASAIRADNFSAFTRTLDRPGETPSALVSAAYYLRHSGLKETTRVGARFARNEARRLRRQILGSTGRTAGHSLSIPPETGKEITQRDLFFALMTLEHRLEGIEERLDRIADQE